MHTHEHHEEIIKEVSAQFKEILEGSEQAVYIYLDDMHKTCNQKFADLLGYASPTEWAAVTEPFPQVFVEEKSQEDLINSFQRAMQAKEASTFSATWKKKDGQTVNTNVILVPIIFQGHALALHFIKEQ